LLGRSATWPTEARTSNVDPRNLEMVFAFAGDSTMTRGLAIGRYRYGMPEGLVKPPPIGRVQDDPSDRPSGTPAVMQSPVGSPLLRGRPR
jgi:hypothetical protein